MTKDRKFTIILLVAAAVLVLVDQFTKLAAFGMPMLGINFTGIARGEYISVIGDFLQFTYVENPGMAFGISFALVWYLFKIEKYSQFMRSAFALILAGAVGNLIDRVFYGILLQGRDLFYGNVIDFILVDIPDINIGNFSYSHWPVFNIADACVTIGVILLLINYKNIPQFDDIKKVK